MYVFYSVLFFRKMVYYIYLKSVVNFWFAYSNYWEWFFLTSHYNDNEIKTEILWKIYNKKIFYSARMRPFKGRYFNTVFIWDAFLGEGGALDDVQNENYFCESNPPKLGSLKSKKVIKCFKGKQNLSLRSGVRSGLF